MVLLSRGFGIPEALTGGLLQIMELMGPALRRLSSDEVPQPQTLVGLSQTLFSDGGPWGIKLCEPS